MMNKQYLTVTLFAMMALAGMATTSAGEIAEGKPAPDFSLPDIRSESGDMITLSDFRGDVVYVDFWASWCLPCLRSLPEINELYSEYRDRGFEVIAITIDHPIEDAFEFLDDLDEPIAYLIAGDEDADVMDRYRVRGMPTSFLINREGVVTKIHEGYREGDIELLERELQALL